MPTTVNVPPASARLLAVLMRVAPVFDPVKSSANVPCITFVTPLAAFEPPVSVWTPVPIFVIPNVPFPERMPAYVALVLSPPTAKVSVPAPSIRATAVVEVLFNEPSRIVVLLGALTSSSAPVFIVIVEPRPFVPAPNGVSVMPATAFD